MRQISAILILLLALAGGCVSKGAHLPPPAADSPDMALVSAFLHSYMQAFNQRDYPDLVNHYSDNAEVMVFDGDERYVVEKAKLPLAFEMKKPVWVKNNVRLTGYEVAGLKRDHGLLQGDVAFVVQSTTWNGNYSVLFNFIEKSGKLLISGENPSR